MKLLKILLLAIALHGVAANANALRVITEEWPPFNYRENGQAAGLGVEMVKALLGEGGVSSVPLMPAVIEFQPWNRAYATALNTPNVLLFTLGRNPDRESSFHWLFKVAPRDIWLFRLAGASTMQVNSLDDVRHARVGTGPREDGSTQALLKAVFEKKKLNARSYDRIIKISQTIADLEGRKIIAAHHMAEAVQMRLSIAGEDRDK